MEVLDDSDLSEDWIVINDERVQDILDESRNMDDAEEEIVKSDECANDSKVIEEEVCDGEQSLMTSDLQLPNGSNLSSKQEECPSERSSTPCICDDLPPDIEMIPAVRAYVHKRNVKLNRLLSLCLVFTLTAGLSLGFGNFWGWLSCSSLKKYYNSEQVQQLNFQTSSLTRPPEIICLQFSKKIDDLESQQKNREDETSTIDQKNKEFSPLDIILDKTYSDQKEDNVFISSIKDHNKRSSIINFSSEKEVLNEKLSIEKYGANKQNVNLMKEKSAYEKLVAGKRNIVFPGSTSLHLPCKINYRNVFDVREKLLPSDLFLFCIKPSFHHSVVHQCSKSEEMLFQNRMKVQEPRKVTTGEISIPPMLLDKDESSKVPKRQYFNKRVSEFNRQQRKEEEKDKMESVPKTRSVNSETTHFTEEEDIQKWFHDHIEHIVKSTQELISLQLHQKEEFSMASSESSLNATEKVFRELLKCLSEKLQNIQLFRSSPLFVAYSHHSRKALQKMAKAIMTPVNKLLKTSAAFLVQDKPLDRKLDKLLRKILESIQKLEYHWVEIKDKWLYLISKEQNVLYVNHRGYEVKINHFNKKHSEQLNDGKSNIYPQNNEDKNMDIRLKNKEGRFKNQFGNMYGNKKHENGEFEYVVKNLHYGSESNGCSKYNCFKYHHGMKYRKWKHNKGKVNEYPERNDANFKTSYKEINAKQQQIRIPSYGKPDNYFFVSTH